MPCKIFKREVANNKTYILSLSIVIMMKGQDVEDVSRGKLKYSVFLRCTTEDHSGCEDLLKTVRREFVSASQICTIEPVGMGANDEKHCVMFDHLVNADQKEAFERKVNSLILEGKVLSRQMFVGSA